MSEIKYYPLTQSQRLIFFQLQHCLRKQVVNICTEIEIEDEINQNLMMQALYLGMLRAPAACVRMHTNPDKTKVQYFSDAAPEKIEFVDFSGKSEEEYEAQLEKWNTTAFPNKLMDTQLYDVKLVKKPNGKYAVYGNYCHLIYDAYAIMATFKDISNIYFALRDHKPMPAELPSPLPAYEADYKYYGSEKMEEDKKYFDEVVFATEPQATSFNGTEGPDYIKDSKVFKYIYSPMMPGDILDLYIDKELNDRVTQFALDNKISPQILYMLAIRMFNAERCGVNDVLIQNAVARRATLAQKRAGGTMVNSVMIRTIFDDDLSFIDACKVMYNTVYETYRHANLSTGDALNVLNTKYKHSQTTSYSNYGFTYQPYFMLGGEMRVKFRHMANKSETQSVYMSIMPCDSDGNMVCNYSYQTKVIKPETLKKFHKFMLEFVEKGMDNPDKPMCEYIKELL